MQLNRVEVMASPTGWLTLKAYHGPNGTKDRIRWSLGTKKQGEAQNRADWIVRCISEGADSSVWPTLKNVLPARTFEMLAKLVGYAPVVEVPKVVPTWVDLRASYVTALDAKIVNGDFSESSKRNYLQTLKEFDSFVGFRGLSKLASINEETVSDFKLWRKKSILAKSNSGKECKRLSFDLTVLRAVWNHTNSKSWLKAGFQSIENPWPVMTKENKPGAKPEDRTQPFSGVELAKMRTAAAAKTFTDSQNREYKLEHGSDLLAFELLLRTGLRRCDCATLLWKNVNLETNMLSVRARKNSEEILMPIHSALASVLRSEKSRRNPSPMDTVLLNPLTGEAYDADGRGLYRRMSAIGERLNIEETRPHRFRCTFAVDSLLKGAKESEVARLLGDTVDTIVKHYLPMCDALSQSTRETLERDGIEITKDAPTIIRIGRKENAA
jgi:integrase